jgi:ketosteroid isomerase-like protein
MLLLHTLARITIHAITTCFLALIILASAASLAEETQPADIAKSFINSLTKRDAAAAIALLHDDAVLEMPYPLASGENKYGTHKMWGEPLRIYVKGIVERNSKIAFDNVVWYETDRDTVILEANGDLVRSKDGLRYQNKYLILFETRDGKVITWREYFNPVVAARTFGIPLESLPY